MKCYYLDYSQQPKGPYPDLWIDQLIHSGMLDDNIQVWCEQIGEWMTWEDYVKKSQDYIECPHCGSQLKIEQEFFEKKLTGDLRPGAGVCLPPDGCPQPERRFSV